MSRDDLIGLLDDPGSQLTSSDPAVRRIAVAATAGHPQLHAIISNMLTTDPDGSVRRECAEVLGHSELRPVGVIETACSDSAVEVREAAVTALGELVSVDSVQLLIEIARDKVEDKLVREAAVASLGAIGDDRALPVLLDLITSGPPQIRRRCVPALSVFDGDDIETALRRAARDRNPMVREAAEMVVGRAEPE